MAHMLIKYVVPSLQGYGHECSAQLCNMFFKNNAKKEDFHTNEC